MASPTKRPTSPDRVDGPSALLQAALLLVPPSATAAELEVRFGDAGARLRPDLAGTLLAELAGMGLVRPALSDGDSSRYVATSLGMRTIGAAVRGEAALQLEDLERLRSDLLSTIAHELRTPLTVVRTSIGLLLDPAAHPTEDQRHSLLLSIQRNGERMQRLIGDVLELSRFRAGSVTLQLRRFSARALADGASADIAPLAARHGQRIEVLPADSPDHRVYGDRRRLEQALLNLVANAQRFSPDGATIRLSVERRGRQTAWVVNDEGPGISPEDQARLFERFFVGHGSREGIGLGLPTALAIAQAHGGTIEVESAVDEGSRFALVVPTAGPGEDR